MAMRYYVPFPGPGVSPSYWGETLPGPHELRIGDAERDAAAADLGEHYAAGRLTVDELNERLDAVFAAKTFGELAHVLLDLPGLGRVPWQAGYQVAPMPGPLLTPDPRLNGAWMPALAKEPSAASDRAGRVAALSLLVLAMAIWLFTALLFARQGYYHPYGYGPYGPLPNHFQHVQLMPDYQPAGPPTYP
jgi:hypothetical protein